MSGLARCNRRNILEQVPLALAQMPHSPMSRACIPATFGSYSTNDSNVFSSASQRMHNHEPAMATRDFCSTLHAPSGCKCSSHARLCQSSPSDEMETLRHEVGWVFCRHRVQNDATTKSFVGTWACGAQLRHWTQQSPLRRSARSLHAFRRESLLHLYCVGITSIQQDQSPQNLSQSALNEKRSASYSKQETVARITLFSTYGCHGQFRIQLQKCIMLWPLTTKSAARTTTQVVCSHREDNISHDVRHTSTPTLRREMSFVSRPSSQTSNPNPQTIPASIGWCGWGGAAERHFFRSEGSEH